MATNQTFVDYQTPIPADWLNNVNNHVNSLDTYEHAASKISNTLTGSVPAGDVQGALANLDGRVTTANNTANTANTTANTANTTANNAMPKAGGNFTGPANANKGADLASAATVNIGAATGEYLNITGTTTITAFGTVQAGTERTVQFTGALTLTHNATTLILPTAANITTTAGDVAVFRSEGSGNWRCISYTKTDGAALLGGRMVLSTAVATTSGTSVDFTSIPSWVKRITVMFNGVSTNGTASVLVQIGTGGVPTTSGYVSGSFVTNATGYGSVSTSTAGFIQATPGASGTLVGNLVITLVSGFTYTGSHNTFSGTLSGVGAGNVTLSGVLNMLRLTTVGGADTFDAGSVNILYEGY